jgi:hypothetical protein
MQDPKGWYEGGMDWDSHPLVEEIRNFRQNYGLDNTFDWCPWDQYDENMI